MRDLTKSRIDNTYDTSKVQKRELRFQTDKKTTRQSSWEDKQRSLASQKPTTDSHKQLRCQQLGQNKTQGNRTKTRLRATAITKRRRSSYVLRQVMKDTNITRTKRNWGKITAHNLDYEFHNDKRKGRQTKTDSKHNTSTARCRRLR